MARQEKSAGAVVYYFDGKLYFLLLRNTLKTTYWEFPKGEIENEEIEETALREVKEETGLSDIKIIPGFKQNLQWFFTFKGELVRKEAVYLLIEIPKEDKDKVKINYEHEAFSWFDYEKALKNLKGRDNKEMLKKAYEFILNYEKQKRLI
ncbi:MAG: NUDIX domain-containing protein [Nanoarchaeota archaeon]